jgi:nitrite reductase/ring-hydroxylating ferredoxin subunit
MTGTSGVGQVSEQTQSLLRATLRDLGEDSTLPGKILNDPEIHALERERIFGRTWVYLAHESEVAAPGDYVVRYVFDDAFIIVRDEAGQVRAHFNSCRHRGTEVCRAEIGNASHFRCPYHGWTYKNTGDLIGVPAGADAYGDTLDKSRWGLRQMPQFSSYKGLLFGTLDPDAPPLEEYLAGMGFYLDLFADRTAGGLEVLGGPQRWIMDANWKLGADNHIGDGYHSLMAHRSMIELGLSPKDARYAMYGEQVHAGNGHGLGLVSGPPNVGMPPFLGLPDDIVQALQARLSADQLAVLRPTVFMHGTVFPNFSFLHVSLSKDHKSPPAPMLTFRVWQPIDANRMEMWSWCLVDRDGSAEYRQAAYETYVHTFGTSGVFEQDDAEIWSSATRALSGQFGRGHHLNYQMGRGKVEPDPDWRGPGEAYPLDYVEFNQLSFYKRWAHYMTSDESADSNDRVDRQRLAATAAKAG